MANSRLKLNSKLNEKKRFRLTEGETEREGETLTEAETQTEKHNK
jgi:hypothetical protein